MENFIECSYLPNGYRINIEGKIINKHNRILKHQISNSGYLFYNLKENKKQKGLFLHRCLALAFIPNPENKKQVNHIDGNKLNNNLNNLEWCTISENTKHAYKLGLKKETVGNLFKGKFGKDHNRSVCISINGVEYSGYSEASRKLNILISTIFYRVKSKNKKWMHFEIKEI
jgi:HNH endonuclease